MKLKSSLKLILLFLLPLISYAQQTEKQQDAATTFKALKIPENQVLYEVTVEADNTPYRVFINDIPLMTTKISGHIKFFANPALAILHGFRRTIFDIFLHFPKGKTEPEAIPFNMLEY